MLGIAITTYNRKNILLEQLDLLQRLTSCRFDIVVCDDGSSDGTSEAVHLKGIKVVGGTNRGIAWNKNRGLFYLRELCGSQIILLLDDDILPSVNGWEQEWIEAVKQYGHINWRTPPQATIGGLNTAANPGVSLYIGGACMAFSRQALSYVGYMDTRFKGYGYEHADLTRRAIRAGFGGFRECDDTDEKDYYYVIDGNLFMHDLPSNTDISSIERNGKILEESGKESIYRNAWRTDDEYELIRSEMSGLDGLDGLNPKGTHFLEFDAKKYLAANPDVASSSFTALHHYRVFGIKEKRPLSL